MGVPTAIDVSVPADSRAPAEFGGERRLVK